MAWIFGPFLRLDGVVNGEDQGGVVGQDRQDQSEQDPSGLEAGPFVAVEEAMIVGVAGVVAMAHDPQGGGDGASPGGEQGADGEEPGLGPGPAGEEWSEVGQGG